jgi:D-glycero-D-manno-heptose 1,7-bisphosphate phosphatase
MSNLIILDRDGVINQDSLQYIKSVDELIFLPGSLEAIAKLTAVDYKIAVATNQSGVSRGYYDLAQLARIHQKLIQEADKAGGIINFIAYCPHLPELGCFCRKPQPGMLLAIARHFRCSLTKVPFVGDRVTDIQAAKAVGASPMVVISPMTDLQELKAFSNIPIFHSLAECVQQLLDEHE